MKLSKLLAWVQRHEYVSVAAILVGFTTIALGNIGRWAIWFDEGYTSYLVRFDYFGIAKETASDVHPPLYYWALKTWVLLFGNHELALRSLSLVFMIVAMVGVYALIRRITHSKSSALLALLAIAVTPIFVHYADEARMYAMASAIVIWATYALYRGEHTQEKKWWWLYGVLVFCGMLTHYYTAFAWLTHWVWRAVEVRKGRMRRFWTKPWVTVHAVAVGVFCFWLPIMVMQVGVVQIAGNGFWIGPITGATVIDYIGDIFLSFSINRLNGWWALAATAITGLFVYILMHKELWRSQTQNRRLPNGEWLLGWMAFLPVVLLIVISMPPMRPTFVDRYVLYSAMIMISLAAIWFSRHLAEQRWRLIGGAVIILSLIGVGNLYQYGSVYNKSSETATRTRDLVRMIDRADTDHTPIIVPAKWTFYEAVPYTTDEHPIFTIDDGDYPWGSMALVRDLPEHKIRQDDLGKYSETQPYVWVLTAGDDYPEPLDSSWRAVKRLQYIDPVSKQPTYSAVRYQTQI